MRKYSKTNRLLKRKTKKKSRSRSVRPYCFLQRFAMGEEAVSVFIGCQNDDTAYKLAKKMLTDQSLAEGIRDGKHPWELPGCVRKLVNDKKNKTAYVLSVQAFKDNWDWYETLIHELHHLVQFSIAEARGAEKEIEFLAYAQGELFREIRRKCQGVQTFNKYELN